MFSSHRALEMQLVQAVECIPDLGEGPALVADGLLWGLLLGMHQGQQCSVGCIPERAPVVGVGQAPGRVPDLAARTTHSAAVTNTLTLHPLLSAPDSGTDCNPPKHLCTVAAFELFGWT